MFINVLSCSVDYIGGYVKTPAHKSLAYDTLKALFNKCFLLGSNENSLHKRLVQIAAYLLEIGTKILLPALNLLTLIIKSFHRFVSLFRYILFRFVLRKKNRTFLFQRSVVLHSRRKLNSIRKSYDNRQTQVIT